MKERKSNKRPGDAVDIWAVDFRKYARETGGRVIDAAASLNVENGVTVSLVDFGYGDWEVTLASIVDSKGNRDDGPAYRSIISVKKAYDGQKEFCAYYKDWNPKKQKTVCDKTMLLTIPPQALIDFSTLVNSGNLEKADVTCPFQGTGIKHREKSTATTGFVDHND